MKKQYAKIFFSLTVLAMIAGCATQSQVITKPQACKPVVKTDQLVQKADNFLIVLDASETMSGMYNNQTKIKIARDIVTSMSQCIPDIKLTGGLRTFGRGYYLFSIFQTDLIYGMKPYARTELSESLKKVDLAIGNTPLAKAINAAADDIKTASGTTAIIIVSDGKPTDDGAVKAAESMKKQYGAKVCLYTIQVGDDYDGKKTLELISKAGECGFSVNADKIAACEGMADFVEKVFFTRKCVDSDGDGVCDDKDECPGTPKGAKVNEKGCWIIGDVLFDFDKHEIKTQAYPVLDDCVTVFKNNPGIKAEIQGHTDNAGKEAYNMKLSARRADAVKQYLVKNGIAAGRLSTKGFGYSKPETSNATPEGRVKNRRVEFKVK